MGDWYMLLSTASTVTVAQGGTGITSNHSMLINLASTAADNVFKASPRPGITGTLGITNGGTGCATAEAAGIAFMNALPLGDTAPTDTSEFIIQGTGNATEKFYRKPASLVWDYIKTKSDATYETKSDASLKLTEAKTYADNAATVVKNELLNGAGTAYDTLKELGTLIDTNTDAIDALEIVAASKLSLSGGTLTGALMLTSGVHYGSTFPSGAKIGQIFFKKV
jgi:hypothetical protein